jgi:hypothetical protein
MTRAEWRRQLQGFASQHPLVIACPQLAVWNAALTRLASQSPAFQAEVRALDRAKRTGPCARCGVDILWSRTAPYEPLKMCEACARAWCATAPTGFTHIAAPARFDDPP